MTFAENLEKARSGDRRAYGMLCNLSAHKLYGVARLVLENDSDAEAVVKKAFDDGFRGIDRINDENHLCAWLSRELTKHMVARLKEYRAEEKTVKSDGSPEKEVFCRLGDLDRLVNALNIAFGYNTKEITVITGLKEETAERKIRDAEKKIGKDRQLLKEYFENAKAPDSLITKAPAVQDLTVEIDKSDNDELIGEMERIAAIAEAEEKGIQTPAASPKLIRFEPAKYSDDEAKKPEELAPQERKIEITPPVKPAPVAEEKPAPVAEKKTAPVAEEKPAPVAEEKSVPAETKAAEQPREIDARTFINVITAQKIKGRDFLKLMGNTRISNDVYREIEQNPNLTKERLIELLENSPLTSADYVKVLTAVKQRNELIARKEQADVLFDIKSKKEEKSAELSTDTRSFTAPVKEEEIKKELSQTEEKKRFEFEKKQPEKEKPVFDFTKKPEPEIKPFMPVQDVEPDDEDDEDLVLDDSDDIVKIPVPAAKAEEKRPSEPEKEQTFREKYKGKEFFIDDDVYYPGVNNGKIIFCAICAVLLFAGSFGIRYLNTGSFLPGSEKQPAVVVEALPESYTSNEDIYKAMTLTENVTTDRSSAYYKADATPYTQVLTKDFCETDDNIYIADGSEIIAFSVNAQNPEELYRITVQEENGEFLGFAAGKDALYLLYESEYDYPISYTVTSSDAEGNPVTADYEALIMRDRVTVERYENGECVLEYYQDGNFVAANITDEAINVATTLNTANGSVAGVPETYLPSYQIEGQDRNNVEYNNITVPGEIGYNGFTVIGTLSGSDARAAAVMGGSQSFVEFDGENCRVIISDKNKTYEENFRFVGSNLTRDSEKIYDGECFGAQFIGKNAAVTYQSTDNTIKVITENGATDFAMAEGEKLSGAAFEDNFVHIVTEMPEGSMLYRVDLNDTQNPAEAKPDAIYSDKLKTYGDNELVGLKVEADESSSRTGLRLSVYGYDGKLNEKRYTIITLDEQTRAEYLRYLSADAEESNLRIAADNGYIAVSTVYFDGISEIERILCFRDDGAKLSGTTDLLLFDINSDYRFLTFRDNVLYVFTDSRIITIDPESGKATGYFNLEEASAPAENDAEAIIE